MSELTSKDLGVLDCIDDMTEEYGSLVTNRVVKRSDVLRLVRMGLAESIGMVCVREENDREREGFRLTDAGQKALITREAS